MHRVTSRIREILPADLPMVPDPDGPARAATEAELLNLGIAHLDGDLYECREQENNYYAAGLGLSPQTAPMVPLVELKGRVLSEGAVQPRHDRLSASVKVDLWRAMVRRGTGKDAKLLEVGADEVTQDDDVISAGIKKVRFSGESER